MKKCKPIYAWAVVGNMKTAQQQLNPIDVQGMWMFPVFEKKEDAIKTRKSSPVLSLKIIKVRITPV